MMQIRFYTTAGCHLCELAAELIQQVQQQINVDSIEIEIGDDDTLTDQYGIRIPVLQFENGSELNWPFTQEDILLKLSS